MRSTDIPSLILQGYFNLHERLSMENHPSTWRVPVYVKNSPKSVVQGGAVLASGRLRRKNEVPGRRRRSSGIPI